MGTKDFIFTVFGHVANAADIIPTGIRVHGCASREVPFASFAGARAKSFLLIFARLSILVENGSSVEIVGIGKHEADRFAHEADRAWRRHIRGLFNARKQEVHASARAIWNLRTPESYPAACLLEPLLANSRKAVDGLPRRFPKGLLTENDLTALNLIGSFLKDPAGHRDQAAKAFVEAELNRARELLDIVEKLPLTPEQRLAVVTDEDATLVLAGAGSGKTSVIVAKAAHLVTRGFRRSSEIMLMSYGAKAAEEMADRVKERTGLPVDARTFHSLGMAIIRAAEGKPPMLAPHATKEEKLQLLIKDIVSRLIVGDAAFEAMVRTWFSEFFAPYKSLWDFTTLSEYLHYVRTHGLRSLKGEQVRSFEECEIANWLYLNGIEYEYEPKYEREVSSAGRRAYRPDFRLTESGVYIEHFGLSKGVGPDGEERLETAPYIDRDRYLADREWKLKVHREHGTVLLETFSHEKAEGRLIECLAERIAPYATPKPILAETMFERLKKAGAIDAFTSLLCTFLHHFKGNGLTFQDCLRKVRAPAMRPRSEAFLSIFSAVFTEYQKALGDFIDFEDMIVRATEYVREGRYESPYRHLLVDEFQDISLGRAKLLKALLDQHADARLFAVGDDWQAIFRFAGSDLAIMRGFAEVFGGTFDGKKGIHAKVDLGRTFRCVDKVALPATRFVTRNADQIPKTVKPAGTVEGKAIRVTYVESGAEHDALLRTLGKLQEGASTEGRKAKVTVLARYNKLKPDNVALLNRGFPSLSIDTLSAHSSKGLEADHVIVVGMNSGRMGFPSEIVDDPVLLMALPKQEPFPNAEERRLFYVALTRARQTVDLIADVEQPSDFVLELVADEEYGVDVVGEIPGQPGGCTRCGGRMLRKPLKEGGGFRYVCEHGSYCGHSAPACPHCKADTPARIAGFPGQVVCSCGARYPVCSACGEGWLIEREGPHGNFLGCTNFRDRGCKGPKSKKPAGAARRRHR